MLSEGSTFRRGPGGLTFAQIENDLAVCARDNTLTLEAGQRHCLSVRYRAEPI